jgi:hypothetical protein
MTNKNKKILFWDWVNRTWTLIFFLFNIYVYVHFHLAFTLATA